MILGALLLGLLVARETTRAGDPDGRAARALAVMVAPVAVGFALLMVLRLADLVVGRA